MIRTNYDQELVRVWGIPAPGTVCSQMLVAAGLMVSTLIAQVTGRGGRALWVAGLPLLFAAVAPAVGREIKVVSPACWADLDGDSSWDNTGLPPFRFQQVFSASDFQDLPDSHHLLVSVAKRPDQNATAPFSEIWGHVQIKLSITDGEPGNISTNFAENIGTFEQTEVYNGPSTLTTANTETVDGPMDFDLVWEFQNPFLYDPDDGNLLVDWITTSGITPSGLNDRFFSPAVAVYADNPDAASGFTADGFPMQFTFVASPGGSTALQAGDADQNYDFNQLDLIQVLVAAKYLTGELATWGEGDWDGAAGGYAGNPPAGNGFFDQLDIVAALDNGLYMAGPYEAIQPDGRRIDAQTSIVYTAATGELAVDAPAGTELTSINIDSASGIFTGQPAANLGGSFDNDTENNIFKATFGSSFGSLSFGNVAQAGLSEQFVLNDLTAIGSVASGGDLGEVDLVYVPEPMSVVLLAFGLVLGLVCVRRVGC